jgi:hypothetical protein
MLAGPPGPAAWPWVQWRGPCNGRMLKGGPTERELAAVAAAGARPETPIVARPTPDPTASDPRRGRGAPPARDVVARLGGRSPGGAPSVFELRVALVAVTGGWAKRNTGYMLALSIESLDKVMEPKPQVTPASLAAAAQKLRRRAHLPLKLICDAECQATWVVGILAARPAQGNRERTPVTARPGRDWRVTMIGTIGQRPDRWGVTPCAWAFLMGQEA